MMMYDDIMLNVLKPHFIFLSPFSKKVKAVTRAHSACSSSALSLAGFGNPGEKSQ